jgi:hypothetical protein
MKDLEKIEHRWKSWRNQKKDGKSEEGRNKNRRSGEGKRKTEKL